MRLPPAFWLALLVCCLAGCASWLGGCSGWDPTDPFTRNAPEVNDAIDKLDAGELESAEEVLENYLGTGPCNEGVIGLPPKVREKPNGSFDLGLVLFYLAERYGQRFGDEELAEAGAEQDELDKKRALEIECAQIIVKAIGGDATVPADLRARAYYLAGNLEFLRKQYEEAVTQYDKALEIVPGIFPEAGGDEIGRDAAHNRAIALRRIAEQDSGPPDAEPDAQPENQDGGDDGGDSQDAGQDGSNEPDGGADDQSGDAGADSGGQDAGSDAGKEQEDEQEPEPEESQEPPPASQSPQIDSLLDELEQAPTYQEEDAKRRAAHPRRRPVMEDK
ncbi:MAG TPA: tetratricopeptide repeat protein [Polyangiaceae bacterium]|jgi:tetratricopeptide (TPR) repeat protein|nr:tetratricopeptide repeat protein [Polyangiaceae bacterium]